MKNNKKNFYKESYSGCGLSTGIFLSAQRMNAHIMIFINDTSRGAVFGAYGQITGWDEKGNIVDTNSMDTILKFFPKDEKVKKIHDWWAKYNNNDLRADCEHGINAKLSDKEIIINTCVLKEKTSNKIKKYYYKKSSVKTPAGHVLHSENEKGVLLKPCPICGYKYGSGWNFREIPENVIKEMVEMMRGQ